MTAGRSEEILDHLRRCWADVPAADPDDLAAITEFSGPEAGGAFVGVRPVDVDITSPGFLSATPLFDIPPRAAAAYLGTYLIFLLTEYGYQKAVGIPTDVFNRAHAITFLTRPRFWTDYAKPYLSERCLAAVEEVAGFLMQNADDFLLDDEHIRQLSRLVRSIRRDRASRPA